MKIGRLTASDRAATGQYPDLSGPVIERLLRQELAANAVFHAVIVPDDQQQIAAKLRELADQDRCALIVTTGGTGITPRDVTPEATREVLEKELPGFGEIMRTQTFPQTPTAILSRGIAGIRGSTLIVNLPGKPAAVTECLSVLLPAIREALAHLRGENPHAQPTTRGGPL